MSAGCAVGDERDRPRSRVVPRARSPAFPHMPRKVHLRVLLAHPPVPPDLAGGEHAALDLRPQPPGTLQPGTAGEFAQCDVSPEYIHGM